MRTIQHITTLELGYGEETINVTVHEDDQEQPTFIDLPMVDGSIAKIYANDLLRVAAALHKRNPNMDVCVDHGIDEHTHGRCVTCMAIAGETVCTTCKGRGYSAGPISAVNVCGDCGGHGIQSRAEREAAEARRTVDARS